MWPKEYLAFTNLVTPKAGAKHEFFSTNRLWMCELMLADLEGNCTKFSGIFMKLSSIIKLSTRHKTIKALYFYNNFEAFLVVSKKFQNKVDKLICSFVAVDLVKLFWSTLNNTFLSCIILSVLKFLFKVL